MMSEYADLIERLRVEAEQWSTAKHRAKAQGRTPASQMECAKASALTRDAADAIAKLEAERDALLGVLKVADDAIAEMFRYYDGGETRGSYDGKPERNQLRKAGYATRAAIAKATHTPAGN